MFILEHRYVCNVSSEVLTLIELVMAWDEFYHKYLV